MASAAVIVVAGGSDETPAPAADTSTTLNVVPPVAPLPGVPVAESIPNVDGVGPIDNGPAAAPQAATPPVKTVVVTAPVAAPVTAPVVVPPVVVPPVVSPPKHNPFPIEQVKPGVIAPEANPFPAGGGPKPKPQQPVSPGGAATGGTSVGP